MAYNRQKSHKITATLGSGVGLFCTFVYLYFCRTKPPSYFTESEFTVHSIFDFKLNLIEMTRLLLILERKKTIVTNKRKQNQVIAKWLAESGPIPVFSFF